MITYLFLCFMLFRLNLDINGGAWCPKAAVHSDATEWLQVDLGTDHIVTAIVTQVGPNSSFPSNSKPFCDILLARHNYFIYNVSAHM